MTMVSVWFATVVLTVFTILADEYRPVRDGAPSVSFLTPGCHLEMSVEGAHWQRLWVNCGSGPHLLSEPSSLTWHVRIRTPEQALELVRLFTSSKACHMVPIPRWVEVTASDDDRDHWLALERRTYDVVCPQSTAKEMVRSDPAKRFDVTRCLVSEDDGNLYSVTERVSENGATETVRKVIVLHDADMRIGTCDPAAPPRSKE